MDLIVDGRNSRNYIRNIFIWVSTIKTVDHVMEKENNILDGCDTAKQFENRGLMLEFVKKNVIGTKFKKKECY